MRIKIYEYIIKKYNIHQQVHLNPPINIELKLDIFRDSARGEKCNFTQPSS